MAESVLVVVVVVVFAWDAGCCAHPLVAGLVAPRVAASTSTTSWRCLVWHQGSASLPSSLHHEGEVEWGKGGEADAVGLILPWPLPGGKGVGGVVVVVWMDWGTCSHQYSHKASATWRAAWWWGHRLEVARRTLGLPV